MAIVSLKRDFCFKQTMMNEKVRKHFISDVLGIPVERIRSARLANTFLWKKYARQKQGILDVRVDLDGDSMVNMELQVRMVSCWDRRSLFYLAKMYTEPLLAGEQYHKLKKCISINILDFSLEDTPSYHRRYKLRDEEGGEFSDMFEIHVIELGKETIDNGPVEEWIRLFNAETEEELDMIGAGTGNPGIAEAIREIKAMGLRRSLRALHEAHLKEIRDWNAAVDYVRSEGREQGRAQGKEEGRAEGRIEGKAEGKAEAKADDILQLLSLKGTIPGELECRIRSQEDLDVLSAWLTVAAQAEDVADFVRRASIHN